jgi:ribosome-binding factor A
VKRVEEGVRDELASLLAHEVKDPGAAGAVVSRVEMAQDLRSAKIYVRLLQHGDAPEARKTLLDALGRARGMLRREITQRLALRSAPELHFAYDSGLDKSMRIDQLLAEIEIDRRK